MNGSVQAEAQIKALNEARTSDTDLPHNAISNKMKQLCNNIVTVFGYVFQPSHMDKYNYYFTKTEGKDEQKKRRYNRVWKHNLHVTCMLPSVVFGNLTDARSIIIASGTLSPLSTLTSELGLRFPVTIQGPAVVQSSNLYACQVSCGPTGLEMMGTFQHTITYEYQDELGKTIMNLASQIPNGMLVFISSYTLLNNLRERWESTGTIDLLNTKKRVFFEDKDRSLFEAALKEYSACIVQSSIDSSKSTGAIFFGVYRGKLAEGMDFAENHACAVLVVGIPFPSKADTDLDLKIEFNNKFQHALQLQSGPMWYRAEAFRALSQALGRCIRHKTDYGAIILIDCRITREVVKKELPKWLSNKIEMRYSMNWSQLEVELSSFFRRVSKERKN